MIESLEIEHLHRPRKIDMVRLLINSIWIFASGFLWSIIVMAFLFLLSTAFSFNFNTESWASWVKEWFLFPFMFSLVVFLWTTITMLFTYTILTVTSKEHYKRNMVTFFNIVLFSVLIYIFILPLYLYVWEYYYENIFLVFILHNLVVFLLFSIVLELINNYTHIFLWVYSSFLWTMITILLATKYGIYANSKWKVILIIFLIPILNFLNYFTKQLIEVAYYNYYKYTGNDPIWNVFYQAEKEEKENG